MNDLLDLLTGRSIDLLRFDAGQRRHVAAVLTDIQRQLLARIAEEDFERLSDWQRRRVTALIDDVNAILSESYSGLADHSQTGLPGLAKTEAKFAAKAVNLAIGAKLAGLPGPDQLTALVDNTLILGAPTAEWWARQESAAQFGFANLVRQGVIEGRTNSDIARQVRGLLDTSRRNAEALTRTSVQAVANGARMLTYSANSDLVAGVMHVSTLDSRTSEVCRARSGKRWDNNRTPVGHSIPFALPPVHWSCRSTLVPLMSLDEHIDGSQSSKDGPVPAEWDFGDWLKT